MKSLPDLPASYIIQAGELPLSGADLLGLIRPVLGRGLPFRFRAGGQSMSPFIRDGDVISIVPIDQKGPRLGEVVAFCYPGPDQLAVHRVIRRQGTTCLLQGDNLPQRPDGLFPHEALLGKVVRIERDGRPVRFGIGPERVFIAIFSRFGIFTLLRQIKSLF